MASVLPLLSSRALRINEEGGLARMSRWERIVREARQQSGSGIATEVARPLSIRELPAALAARGLGVDDSRILLHESPLAQSSMHEYLTGAPKSVALCVGPEGGFSQDEVDFLPKRGLQAPEAGRRDPAGRDGRVIRGRSGPDYPVGALVMDPQAPVNRISVLGVPLDILPPEGIEDLVLRFADGKNHQIVLLSLWDLMRARRSGEFRTMIAGASLVLPISLSITKGARFLRRSEPVRYMPFDFVVKLLAALEKRTKSVYILGIDEGRASRRRKAISNPLSQGSVSSGAMQAAIPNKWSLPSSRRSRRPLPASSLSALAYPAGRNGFRATSPASIPGFTFGAPTSSRYLPSADPSLRSPFSERASNGCRYCCAGLGSLTDCSSIYGIIS